MTMGSHQRAIGKDQARFTPRLILDPLGKFDTDVCAGDPRPFDIATRNITAAENSLGLDWRALGRKWCNPPFHRYMVGHFVSKMCEAGKGTMLLHVRTETKWFQPIFDAATSILWLAGRIIFLKADGSPCTIENPKSEYFGQVANSGAPVALIAFGDFDSDVLADVHVPPVYERDRLVWPKGRLPGAFQPLRFARYVLVSCLEDGAPARSWRSIVAEWLRSHDGPVSVAELYEAFRGHPKTKANPNWQAKLRQTLQRGAGVRVGPDQWVPA